MNILLWALQVLFGVYFLFMGIEHFNVSPGLPTQMAWIYELSPGLHIFSGTAEILGGLGLILPGLTRIRTRLTPLAALGLVFVMIGAAVWHVQRSEVPNIIMNIIIAGLVGFIAYGRWKLRPLRDRTAVA